MTLYSVPRKCPLCGFVTSDRAVYWAHRLIHEEQFSAIALTRSQEQA